MPTAVPAQSDESQRASFLSLYLGPIDATPLLSAAEERRIARRFPAGDLDVRDQRSRANRWLVVHSPRRSAGKGLAFGTGLPRAT